jgi:hypothetical protein
VRACAPQRGAACGLPRGLPLWSGPWVALGVSLDMGCRLQVFGGERGVDVGGGAE